MKYLFLKDNICKGYLRSTTCSQRGVSLYAVCVQRIYKSNYDICEQKGLILSLQVSCPHVLLVMAVVLRICRGLGYGVIQTCSPVGHEQFTAFYSSLQLSMRILMNTYLIPTTCYCVVIATSICQPLWVAVTLHRLQGEILNYLLQVCFTALSRYTLVNICKANERPSSQCCVCFGCRSVLILQGEVPLVPLGAEYGLLGRVSVPGWSGWDGHGCCKSRP